MVGRGSESSLFSFAKRLCSQPTAVLCARLLTMPEAVKAAILDRAGEHLANLKVNYDCMKTMHLGHKARDL